MGVDDESAGFFLEILIVRCFTAYKNGNAEEHAHAAASTGIGLPSGFRRCAGSHGATIAFGNGESNGTLLLEAFLS